MRKPLRKNKGTCMHARCPNY